MSVNTLNAVLTSLLSKVDDCFIRCIIFGGIERGVDSSAFHLLHCFFYQYVPYTFFFLSSFFWDLIPNNFLTSSFSILVPVDQLRVTKLDNMRGAFPYLISEKDFPQLSCTKPLFDLRQEAWLKIMALCNLMIPFSRIISSIPFSPTFPGLKDGDFGSLNNCSWRGRTWKELCDE